MSDEYVSKVAISKAITAEALEQNLDSLYDNEAKRYRRAAERIVAGMPAADVAPVQYGRWVISRTDYGWNGAEFPTHCKCDQCGREIPYQDQDNYCPNCGAKMEDEE